MTEAEAMTRACCGPFAGRLPYGDASMAQDLAVQGTHPDYAAETAARWPCIGRACMAWVWTREPKSAIERSESVVETRPGLFQTKVTLPEKAVIGEGGCGLVRRGA